MKGNARLIYKSFNTCFRTFLPVYFYGLPGAKIVVLFVREKENSLTRNEFDWVVASHLDFWYDYKSDTILDLRNREHELEEFKECVDKLEQRIRIIKTIGSFLSYRNAQQFYNSNASKLLFNHKPAREILSYSQYC